jgi:hypothetical protein
LNGKQDWERRVSDLQDYLAVFIGVTGKEVYEDLMGRMKGGKDLAG